MGPFALLSLQQTAGNDAVRTFLQRQDGAVAEPQAASVDVAPEVADGVAELKGLLPGIGSEATREAVLRVLLRLGGRYEEVMRAFDARSTAEFDDYLRRMMAGPKDGARAFAYLKYGRLRLADKIFIASIEARTDEDTLWRLLPEASGSLVATTGEFKETYGSEFKGEDELLDGKGLNALAGLVAEEMSGADEVKGLALLSFGALRPVDELRMAVVEFSVSDDALLAAIGKAAASASAGGPSEIERQYHKSYKAVLGADIEGKVGKGSDTWKRAQLFLFGKYTARERIRLAVEGTGTAWREIWAALTEVTETERKELAKEWDEQGEIYRLIHEEWTATETDEQRIRAILTIDDRSGIDQRLVALGVDIGDEQAVAKAALKDDLLDKTFATAWTTGDFRKRFTDDGRKREAVNWGEILISGDVVRKLRLAARIDSSEGVVRMISDPGMGEEQKRQVRDDKELFERLRAVRGFDQVEARLAPSDPQARAEWLKSTFGRESSWASEHSDAAEAFQDEMREVDAALAKAKDPNNLTDEDRARLDPLLKRSEDALGVYLKVRDELDALAIQALTVAAGVILTVATGGAGAAVTAELLSAQVAAQVARVALANALLKLAVNKVVKGDRFQLDSAEAGAIFVSGAVEGAVSVMATPAALRLLSEEYRLAADAAGRKAAAAAFESVGKGTAKAALEGGMTNAATAAFDEAAKRETWTYGFADGFKSVSAGMIKSGVQGAATGGAVEAIKLTIFGTAKGPTGTGGEPGVLPASAVNAQEARRMVVGALTADSHEWRYWTGLASQMGEHTAAYKAALTGARREILEDLCRSMQAEFERLGVMWEIRGGAEFDHPIDVLLRPNEHPAALGEFTKRSQGEQFKAAYDGVQRLREEFRKRFGTDLDPKLQAGATLFEGEPYDMRPPQSDLEGPPDPNHAQPGTTPIVKTQAGYDRLRDIVVQELRSGQRRIVKVVPIWFDPMSEAAGFVGDLRYVEGRSLDEIAATLGADKFIKPPPGKPPGVTVYEYPSSALASLTPDDVQLMGYTQSSAGRSPDLASRDYPPGPGAPQWNFTRKLPVTKLADVEPGERLAP